MFCGTASSAKFTDADSSDQVPQVITSAIAMLTAGSSHSQPVIITATAAITTPSDTAASAAMCMKAPRILMSSLRPRRNIRAVAVLIAMPTAATQITVVSATGSGRPRRCTASHRIMPTATSSSTALNSEARMELRLRP